MRIFIFITALVSFILGLYFEHHFGFPIIRDENGTLGYALSSGSDDAAIMGLGLSSFVVTVIYCIISFIKDHDLEYAEYVYGFNWLIFSVFVFLVSLDSSFLRAADFGVWVPLFGVILPAIPMAIILGKRLVHLFTD